MIKYLATAKKQAEDSKRQTVEADPVATQQAHQQTQNLCNRFLKRTIIERLGTKKDWFGKDEVMTYVIDLLTTDWSIKKDLT